MSKKTSKETLQEYLARGGKIKVVPPVPPKQPDRTPVKSTVISSVATILTYEDADLLYGTPKEVKVKKKSTKSSKKVDDLKLGITNLPDHIRKKLGL